MSYKKSNANGQATMANSEPVVIASDQSTVPVSLASVPSHAVTNAGTFATQVDGSALTALQLIDDVVLAEDAAHGSGDKGVMALAVRKDTAAAIATTDGDYSPLQVDATGGLRLAGLTSSGDALASDSTLQLVQENTQAIEDFVVPAFKTLGTDTYTEATTKGVVIGAVRRDADTTLVNTTNEVAPLQVDANGYLKVEVFDGGGSHTVDNNGTFVTQVDGSALTALQLIDDPVFADDAAFTLSTSKGHVMAGVAVQTDGTDPGAVSAEGDAAAVRTDVNRILLVNETHPRFWHVSADYASAQTNTSVKASPGASLSLYITDIQISNGATAGNITLLDGSGGTVLYEVYPGITGGAVLSLRSPIKLTAATALCITSTTVTTHSVFVSGYIAP